jgi:hypothetical protein
MALDDQARRITRITITPMIPVVPVAPIAPIGQIRRNKPWFVVLKVVVDIAIFRLACGDESKRLATGD